MRCPAVVCVWSWQYIGGGVLSHGCVQEEILFAICGECCASLLFCEVMERNEALLIVGAERFAAYTGYRLSFRFAGPWQGTEAMGLDDLGRPRGLRAILAIDAIPFAKKIAQWSEAAMARELLKAYAGFSIPTDVLTPAPAGGERAGEEAYSALSTGNWGCGAFNGDVPLKAFLQIIAAAMSGRSLRSDTLAQSTERTGQPCTSPSSDSSSFSLSPLCGV